MGQARDEAGNIWETDAQGNAVRLVQAADQQQGGVVTLPPDAEEQARLRIAQNQDSRAGSMQGLREDLLRAQIAKAEADAAKAAQGTAGAATGDARLQARTANINSLVEQINRVQELYEQGPGSTSGLASLGDYLPNPANRQFDTAAAGLAEQGLAAFRVPGIGAQSDAELRQFVQANRPEASDFDTAIEEKLRQLRNRVDATRQTMGLPPAQWAGVPAQQPALPNAWTADRLISGAGNAGAAPAGATMGTRPIPPEMQAEFEQGFSTFMRNGRVDPNAYAAFRAGLDKKYGFPEVGMQYYIGDANRLNQGLAQPGASINVTIPEPARELSQGEQNRNNAVNNPVGAALAGFTDMVGFGGVSALAPEQMAALGESQPLGMGTGQVLGSIGGTAAIGKLGTATLGRAAPSLLRGGAGAQFGRNLATDAAYGGIYGGVTEGDPLTGAALGAVGSAGGQGVGKLGGAMVGGISTSPAIQRLMALGIPTTVGQRLGGIARSIEDAMTSIPGIGDLVNARRIEGLRGFNRAAFGEAGAPIGATVNNIGEQGVEELLNQAGNAYDSATGGVRVQFDPQFVGDMGAAESIGKSLPDDLSARFGRAIENRVWPATDPGELTGEAYQQAFRGLKGYRSEVTRPGFEQDYRDGLTMAMDALTGQMQRGGGDAVVSGLRSADQAYRGGKTLQRAVQAARNGSRSGEVQTFTPSQLNDAATQAANKFGGGRQMAQLIDDGQSTLPSRIPDSGTGRRLATMALPSVLGGGALLGGGANYAAGGDATSGAGYGLTLAGLLALGGTRGGQRVLNRVLFDRGPRAEMIGRAIRKRAGLFGSAALPLALEAGM